MLAAIHQPATGIWILGNIDKLVARPLSLDEIHATITREVVLRTEVERLSARCDDVTKVASDILDEWGDVIAALGKKEASGIDKMRAIIGGKTP